MGELTAAQRREALRQLTTVLDAIDQGVVEATPLQLAYLDGAVRGLRGRSAATGRDPSVRDMDF